MLCRILLFLDKLYRVNKQIIKCGTIIRIHEKFQTLLCGHANDPENNFVLYKYISMLIQLACEHFNNQKYSFPNDVAVFKFQYSRYSVLNEALKHEMMSVGIAGILDDTHDPLHSNVQLPAKHCFITLHTFLLSIDISN